MSSSSRPTPTPKTPALLDDLIPIAEVEERHGLKRHVILDRIREGAIQGYRLRGSRYKNTYVRRSELQSLFDPIPVAVKA